MRRVGYALLLLVGATAYGADVYRSTEADGTVTYSDRPQGKDSQYIFVATPHAIAQATAAAAGAQRAARANAQAAAKPGAPTDPNAGIEAAQPSAAELAQQREKNCALAKERQQRYSEAHKLYRSLPNGDREYLSDSDIDQARAQAAADIKSWCR